MICIFSLRKSAIIIHIATFAKDGRQILKLSTSVDKKKPTYKFKEFLYLIF